MKFNEPWKLVDFSIAYMSNQYFNSIIKGYAPESDLEKLL